METRAQVKKKTVKPLKVAEASSKLTITKEELRKLQEEDESLQKLWKKKKYFNATDIRQL